MQAGGDTESFFYAGSIDGQSILSDDVETSSNAALNTNLQQDDVVIVLIGQTGTGKSSFANRVTGAGDTGVGHSLQSCTNAIRVLRHSSPDTSSDFVLIDTPGFNDTHLSDIQILETITKWLETTYRRHITLAGVLYFHRISDPRLSGSERQNIDMFEALVGKVALENVIIVSTMWDEIRTESAVAKETMLKEVAWKSMIGKGARTARHDNTRDSALNIVSMLSGAREHLALLVQKEMVTYGKALPDTTVGQRVASIWSRLRKVADEVIFGLEKKKAVEGWSEELGREIEKQRNVKNEVSTLQQRWFGATPLRQMFGLGSISESRVGQKWPQIANRTPPRQSSSGSNSSTSCAPSLSSAPSTASSDCSPITPIYSVSQDEIPTYALNCLNYAASFKAAVSFHSLDALTELNLFIVKKVKEMWPEERSFAYPIIHLAWFVLAIINNVGERDEDLPSNNVDDEDLDGVFVDPWKIKIERLVEELVEDLNPMVHIMENIKALSARQRARRKRQAMDRLVSNARICVICSKLASWVHKDALSLPIFKGDATVLLLHQRITETLLPYKNEKQRKYTDPDTSLRIILGQQHLNDRMRAVQSEVGVIHRFLEKLHSGQSPPPSENNNIIIANMNCNAVIKQSYTGQSVLPARRRGSTFSKSKLQRKQSMLSVESTSTTSTCTVTSHSSPPAEAPACD